MIEERSDGRITIPDRFWGGALGTVPEHLALVKKGTVQIGHGPWGAFPAEFPAGEFERLFLFGPNDPYIYTKAFWQIMDEFPCFDEMFAAQNVKLVLNLPWGYYNMISFEPIVTLDDFKGKVIAVWGVISPKWVEPLGAGAEATASVERYLSLKQHVVDGSMMSVQTDVDCKLYEVAKHYTLIGTMGVIPYTHEFNLDTWNKLPPDLQKMIIDTGREVSLDHCAFTIGKREAAYKTLEEHGVTFYDMSEADKTEWAGMMTDLPREWAEEREAKGYPAFAILNRWVEITEELGHEWRIDWKPYLKK